MNEAIDEILKNAKTIAVVGASPKPNRDSGKITEYLKSVGYKVFPINPLYDEVAGLKCYKSLSDVSEKIEIVNIFRKSEEVMPIVEEAIKIGAETIWMQFEVINQEAAKKAEAAGLKVVMDRCIYVEHRNRKI